MRSNTTKVFAVVLAASVMFALVVASFGASPQGATAAPMPAPTPVSSVDRANDGQYFSFFSAESMAADTTSDCFELGRYNLADVYYEVDVTDAQTVTLYFKFGNTESGLVNSVAFASSVATDTANMQQAQLFGRYACIYADVETTATVDVTVNAWAK